MTKLSVAVVVYREKTQEYLGAKLILISNTHITCSEQYATSLDVIIASEHVLLISDSRLSRLIASVLAASMDTSVASLAVV